MHVIRIDKADRLFDEFYAQDFTSRMLCTESDTTCARSILENSQDCR